jgi:bifunctional pyridoxal-dependent enzyme with beta-cystathionase and maltose regulon repressor activities
MKYDFDREINRKDTQSAKWGVIQDPRQPVALARHRRLSR